MSEVGTNERLLRSDVTLEESRKIERVLRRNNISYFEKWNFHTGVFKFLNNSKNSKCDICSYGFYGQGKGIACRYVEYIYNRICLR